MEVGCHPEQELLECARLLSSAFPRPPIGQRRERLGSPPDSNVDHKAVCPVLWPMPVHQEVIESLCRRTAEVESVSRKTPSMKANLLAEREIAKQLAE